MLVKYINLLIVLFFILHIIACNTEKPVWESTYTLDEGYWSWAEKASFHYEVKDTTSFHDLILEIETTKDYPFQNLYTRVETIFPQGDTTEQVLSFDIYNKFGVQNGDCSKDECRIQFIMQEKFRFKDPGNHTFNINQHLRTDSIRNVKSLTLKLFTVREEK